MKSLILVTPTHVRMEECAQGQIQRRSSPVSVKKASKVNSVTPLINVIQTLAKMGQPVSS